MNDSSNENQTSAANVERSKATPDLNAASSFTPGPWKVRAATFCDDGIPSYEVVMPGSQISSLKKIPADR